MQPIIYVRTEDKNEMLYTTKIIQNELMEYVVNQEYIWILKTKKNLK